MTGLGLTCAESHALLHKRVYTSEGHVGTVRYIGNVASSKGIWYGIELDEPLGKHDGTLNGLKYFNCAFNHGIFLSINEITSKNVDKSLHRTLNNTTVASDSACTLDISMSQILEYETSTDVSNKTFNLDKAVETTNEAAGKLQSNLVRIESEESLGILSDVLNDTDSSWESFHLNPAKEAKFASPSCENVKACAINTASPLQINDFEIIASTPKVSNHYTLNLSTNGEVDDVFETNGTFIAEAPQFSKPQKVVLNETFPPCDGAIAPTQASNFPENKMIMEHKNALSVIHEMTYEVSEISPNFETTFAYNKTFDIKNSTLILDTTTGRLPSVGKNLLENDNSIDCSPIENICIMENLLGAVSNQKAIKKQVVQSEVSKPREAVSNVTDKKIDVQVVSNCVSNLKTGTTEQALNSTFVRKDSDPVFEEEVNVLSANVAENSHSVLLRTRSDFISKNSSSDGKSSLPQILNSTFTRNSSDILKNEISDVLDSQGVCGQNELVQIVCHNSEKVKNVLNSTQTLNSTFVQNVDAVQSKSLLDSSIKIKNLNEIKVNKGFEVTKSKNSNHNDTTTILEQGLNSTFTRNDVVDEKSNRPMVNGKTSSQKASSRRFSQVSEKSSCEPARRASTGNRRQSVSSISKQSNLVSNIHRRHSIADSHAPSKKIVKYPLTKSCGAAPSKDNGPVNKSRKSLSVIRLKKDSEIIGENVDMLQDEFKDNVPVTRSRKSLSVRLKKDSDIISKEENVDVLPDKSSTPEEVFESKPKLSKRIYSELRETSSSRFRKSTLSFPKRKSTPDSLSVTRLSPRNSDIHNGSSARTSTRSGQNNSATKSFDSVFEVSPFPSSVDSNLNVSAASKKDLPVFKYTLSENDTVPDEIESSKNLSALLEQFSTVDNSEISKSQSYFSKESVADNCDVKESSAESCMQSVACSSKIKSMDCVELNMLVDSFIETCNYVCPGNSDSPALDAKSFAECNSGNKAEKNDFVSGGETFAHETDNFVTITEHFAQSVCKKRDKDESLDGKLKVKNANLLKTKNNLLSVTKGEGSKIPPKNVGTLQKPLTLARNCAEKPCSEINMPKTSRASFSQASKTLGGRIKTPYKIAQKVLTVVDPVVNREIEKPSISHKATTSNVYQSTSKMTMPSAGFKSSQKTALKSPQRQLKPLGVSQVQKPGNKNANDVSVRQIASTSILVSDDINKSTKTTLKAPQISSRISTTVPERRIGNSSNLSRSFKNVNKSQTDSAADVSSNAGKVTIIKLNQSDGKKSLSKDDVVSIRQSGLPKSKSSQIQLPNKLTNSQMHSSYTTRQSLLPAKAKDTQKSINGNNTSLSKSKIDRDEPSNRSTRGNLHSNGPSKKSLLPPKARDGNRNIVVPSANMSHCSVKVTKHNQSADKIGLTKIKVDKIRSFNQTINSPPCSSYSSRKSILPPKAIGAAKADRTQELGFSTTGSILFPKNSSEKQVNGLNSRKTVPVLQDKRKSTIENIPPASGALSRKKYDLRSAGKLIHESVPIVKEPEAILPQASSRKSGIPLTRAYSRLPMPSSLNVQKTAK